MKKHSILESYAIWLKNQGIGSVNIITSGISKVNEEFFKPVRQKDMFNELPDAIKHRKAVDWLIPLESLINLEYEKTVVRRYKEDFPGFGNPIVQVLDLKEKKKLESRKYALHKFTQFVKSLQDSQEDDQTPSLDSSITFLPKEELEKIPLFHNYISAKSDLCFFPVVFQRLFKFFSKDENWAILKRKKLYWGDNRDLTPIERFNEWHSHVLKKTRAYSTHRVFMFSQIDGLLLDKEKEKVFILVKGHRYELVSQTDVVFVSKKKSFKPRIDPRVPFQKIFKKHQLPFPTLRLFTDMVKEIAKDVELEVSESDGSTRIVRLDEFKGVDGKYLRKYLLNHLPKHKVAFILPHLLLELYQLAEYISPKLIVR